MMLYALFSNWGPFTVMVTSRLGGDLEIKKQNSTINAAETTILNCNVFSFFSFLVYFFFDFIITDVNYDGEVL